MKLIFQRGLIIAGQILLLILFGVGIGPLMVRETAGWLIAAYISIVSISGLMLIGWLVPSLRCQRWFWWINLIWIFGWLIYFGIVLGIVIIAINRLASLG